MAEWFSGGEAPAERPRQVAGERMPISGGGVHCGRHQHWQRIIGRIDLPANRCRDLAQELCSRKKTIGRPIKQLPGSWPMHLRPINPTVAQPIRRTGSASNSNLSLVTQVQSALNLALPLKDRAQMP